MTKVKIFSVFLLFLLFIFGCLKEQQVPIKNFEQRSDGAVRITNCYPKSCQNPVFSPDSKELLFTRFSNGYNKGPSELVKINLESGEEEILVNAIGDSVNVPYGSWVGDQIVFASDIFGKEEILVMDNERELVRLTNNIENGFRIEPVFNPRNTSEILYEFYVENEPHRIGLLVMPKGEFYLTNDSSYDDRLPSWSQDGKRILWQRSEAGRDNWSIFVSEINQEHILSNVRNISSGPGDTDNSWSYEGQHILSSSYGDGSVPNIFAFSLDGERSRITNSQNEDGAPSQSPDMGWVAFESHEEEESSEIWVIESPRIIKTRK